MIVLGIESSCDDTAAAIIKDDLILSSIVSSQHDIHQRFGGIVPELASRDHVAKISTVVTQALSTAGVTLDQVDLIAATQGPGLIGSLLVGFSFAKSLAYRATKPFVGVDHMSGHILSAFLEPSVPRFPYVALIVSGGTTSLFLVNGFLDYQLVGRTRDDAAGEAFDKTARILKLGYPGGPIISKLAQDAADLGCKFPRAWLEEDSLDFSFSGLKTAVSNYVDQVKLSDQETELKAICKEFQEAVVEVLVTKAIRAAEKYKTENIVLGGGVAANDCLREAMITAAKSDTYKTFVPAKKNCTDNGAMIALAGLKKFEAGLHSAVSEDVFPRSRLGN
ncbi:MAG: tRNA (adenosine(37)-N6)-threonylcarbamoyltransferase complex transferase subunit TsaD [Desulfobulbaceae bacterium]|nr:MAG: tRNA (adenosine(37)-N6)-threonylcarbamoyltransferase complex transferase subunit TsaD [Desulfobulbaceae bacterium]